MIAKYVIPAVQELHAWRHLLEPEFRDGEEAQGYLRQLVEIVGCNRRSICRNKTLQLHSVHGDFRHLFMDMDQAGVVNPRSTEKEAVETFNSLTSTIILMLRDSGALEVKEPLIYFEDTNNNSSLIIGVEDISYVIYEGL